MKFVLKFILASLIGIGWFFFSRDSEVSLILFAFVLAVLLITPKKNQNYEEREDFKAKVQEKKEKQILLAEERILEKQQAKNKKRSN